MWRRIRRSRPPACSAKASLVVRLVQVQGEKLKNRRASEEQAPRRCDDDGCQGRVKEAGAAGPKHGPTGMRNTELRRDGESRTLLREERKLRAIMQQIEEMEHKDKDKTVNGNAQVSENRRFRDACDTGGGEGMSAQRAHGEASGAGGEQLENKRKKCATHKQGGLTGGEAVKKGAQTARTTAKRTVASTARQASVAQPPNTRMCKQCVGLSICEHNCQRNTYKQCGGASICV